MEIIDMENQSDEIREELSDLIYREILGQLDARGRTRLSELRSVYASQEPGREQVLRRLRQGKEFDGEAAYVDFIRGYQNQRRFRRIVRVGVGVAAMLAIVLGVTLLWPAHKQDQSGKEIVKNEVLLPGKSKAFITLANGQQIELGKGKQHKEELNGAVLAFDSVAVRYEKVDRLAGPLVYNTLTIPRGGEFQLVLGDGTKVWMNSDSKLKYPVAFTAANREVFLEGEAYFDVAKERQHPFIVHTFRGEVKVLGTGFNVRAYEEESRVVTTLVKGRVAYHSGNPGGEPVIIQPGYQVEDREGEKLALRKVDVTMFVGWKDGRYVFENTSLAEIMLMLSKWYDVEVFYKREEPKNLHFTGDLERYENIGDFLEFMEMGGNVRFVVDGKTIIVE